MSQHLMLGHLVSDAWPVWRNSPSGWGIPLRGHQRVGLGGGQPARAGSGLNWSLDTSQNRGCRITLSLGNKHLCTQESGGTLSTAQHSQCRTPTWKQVLTSVLWKSWGSSMTAPLAYNSSISYSHSGRTKFHSKVQPSLQREVTQSPVSQQYLTLLVQRWDTQHLCCHCATLHRRHHPLRAPSCSSEAAALLVQQEEGFPMAAAEFCFSGRRADELPLPAHVPLPVAFQHTRGTIAVTRKSSGVKHPDGTNHI